MAKFTKGTSGNPNGRPKGSKGKAKQSLLERVQNLIDDNLDLIEKDLKSPKLKPADRIKAITGLLQYVLPKQQSINLENQIALEYRQLEILLANAPEEAAALIAAKMLELKAKGDQP